MNQKILWKIQSLWEQYHRESQHVQKISVPEEINFGFHNMDTFDFTPSEEPVFSDDYGSYRGLQHQQVIECQGKMVILCDNHNKMLVPIFHLYHALKRPLKIVHIDAHRDDAEFNGRKPGVFDKEALTELLKTTRISDFFDALCQTNTISELIRVTDSDSFVNYQDKEFDLLSLDIDIFGPEGDFVAIDEKIRVIAQAWKHSSVICIAMSPGFIDQDFARAIIEILTSKESNQSSVMM